MDHGKVVLLLYEKFYVKTNHERKEESYQGIVGYGPQLSSFNDYVQTP